MNPSNPNTTPDPPPPPPKKPKTTHKEKRIQHSTQTAKTRTAAHLEHIALAFMQAINTRNFCPSQSPWRDYVSPSFSGDMERPPGAAILGLKGIEEQMATYRYCSDMYPRYAIRIFDLNTSVDEKVGRAVMIFNGETVGLVEGVVLPSVGTLEFVREEEGMGGGERREGVGNWKCVSFRGARGTIDGTECGFF